MDVMIQAIMGHTQKHRSYVVSYDNIASLRIGWICPLTDTFFCMYYSNIATGRDPEISKILKSPVARNLAACYLSNCNSNEEYNKLKKQNQ